MVLTGDVSKNMHYLKGCCGLFQYYWSKKEVSDFRPSKNQAEGGRATILACHLILYLVNSFLGVWIKY